MLMSKTITLYRPVGPKELELIRESGWRRFPPRLPEQPIFYPVVQEEYALGAAEGLEAEVDAAFGSGRVQSGTMIQFTDKAGPLSGSGPKVGTETIWYHDNVKVPGAGPSGSTVQIRTHSPNPSAPPNSFARGNYTTQVNTNSGLYLLPNGVWRPLFAMTPEELAGAHFPAGN